jgi:hypothetical protein
MLQVFIQDVSSVFLDVLLQVCLSRCCIRFTHMLQVFLSRYGVCLQWFSSIFHVFLQVFQKHVSSVSFVFRRFANVASGCFKSRSSIAHVAIRIRSGGGTTSPRARFGGASSVWAVRGHMKPRHRRRHVVFLRARAWIAGATAAQACGRGPRAGRLGLAVPFIFLLFCLFLYLYFSFSIFSF